MAVGGYVKRELRGIAVYTRLGTELHEDMCEAFLNGGGFAIFDDDDGEHLYLIETMAPAALAETFLWRLRPAAMAGAA